MNAKIPLYQAEDRPRPSIEGVGRSHECHLPTSCTYFSFGVLSLAIRFYIEWVFRFVKMTCEMYVPKKQNSSSNARLLQCFAFPHVFYIVYRFPPAKKVNSGEGDGRLSCFFLRTIENSVSSPWWWCFLSSIANNIGRLRSLICLV